MPERVEAVEFVKMTEQEMNKAAAIDDKERLYYQKSLPLSTISSAESLRTKYLCDDHTAKSGETRLTIVQDHCNKPLSGKSQRISSCNDHFSPGKSRGKSRCSLWMLWLKFSSFLYLILILLLAMWALHQYKESQEETTLYQHQSILPAPPSALSANNGESSSKALLHYNLEQPTRDPELIDWKMTPDSYMTGNDITYKNRRYYINTSGYYEVQCRLQFDTYNGEVPDKNTNVVFSIIRSTRSQNNKNLMSEKSTLEPRELRGIQLGPTVFQLEANDSVYVSVLNPQFVYPTRDNYFAIRRID